MPNPFDAVSCFFLKPVSGFIGCFANPRTAFGFKRRGVFNPHLSGVIISAAPIGALFCHPRRPSRQICGFGLANTGAGTAKIPAGMTDFITPGAATIRIAKHDDGAKPGGIRSQNQNPEAAMLAQSESSIEGLTGKIPDEPEKGLFQKWHSNLFLKVFIINGIV